MRNDSPTDHELLAEFVKAKDERGLRKLMDRHLGLAFSTAFRSCGSHEIAVETSQDTFIQLIHDAEKIMRKKIPIAAWIHRFSRFKAIDMLRSEKARKRRESAAFEEMEASGQTIPSAALAILDQIIDKLPPLERELILQRYFVGSSLSSIGSQHGLSEDATRMRISRALGGLRDRFARKGFITTSAILAATLAAEAARSPSPSVAARIFEYVSVSKGTAAGSFSLFYLMTTTKKCILGIALALSAITAVSVVSKQSDFAKAKGRDGGGSASAPSSKHETATGGNRTGGRQEKKAATALEAKYGSQKARMALKAADTFAMMNEELQHTETPNEESRQKQATQAYEYLAETLSLDASQTEALVALAPRFAVEKKKTEEEILKRARTNSADFAETLLALDAWKRQKISQADFEGVFSKNWERLSANGESTMEGAEFYSRTYPHPDPLRDYPTLSEEVLAVLPPDAAERYRQMRQENQAAATDIQFVPKSIEEISEFSENSQKLIKAMMNFENKEEK